jgi:hypothetical protein
MFSFQGTDTEYIEFLESKLLKASLTPPQALHRESSCKLQFVEYQPDPSGPQSTPWQKQLHSFISEILRVKSQWDKARDKAGMPTIEMNRQAICFLMAKSPVTTLNGSIQPKIECHEADLIDRGLHYGQYVFACVGQSEFFQRVVQFQSLIFVSYCCVLIHIGRSKDGVYNMMQQCINSQIKYATLDVYRYGCIWVNQCMAQLLENGWGHRSWEIFLLS